MRQHLERRLEVLAREIRKRPPRLHAAPTPSWLDPRIRVFNEQHDALAVPVRTPGKSTLREVVETVAVGVASTSEHAGFKTGDRVVITHPEAWCNGYQATLEINKGANFFQEVRTTFDERPGLIAPYCTWTLSALGKHIQHVAEEKSSPPPILPNGTRVRLTARCVEVCIPRECVGEVGTIRRHITYCEEEQRHSYNVLMEDGRIWSCGEPRFEVLAAEKRPFAVGQIRKIVATKEELKDCGLVPGFLVGESVVITAVQCYEVKIGRFACKLRARSVDGGESFQFPAEFLA